MGNDSPHYEIGTFLLCLPKGNLPSRHAIWVPGSVRLPCRSTRSEIKDPVADRSLSRAPARLADETDGGRDSLRACAGMKLTTAMYNRIVVHTTANCPVNLSQQVAPVLPTGF
jgi:hypothetical protein